MLDASLWGSRGAPRQRWVLVAAPSCAPPKRIGHLQGLQHPRGQCPPNLSWVFQAWQLPVPLPMSWHFTPRCSAFPACRWSIVPPAHQPSRTAPIWPWRRVQAHPRAGQDVAEGSGSGCCPHPLLGVGGSQNAWLAPGTSVLMTLALCDGEGNLTPACPRAEPFVGGTGGSPGAGSSWGVAPGGVCVLCIHRQHLVRFLWVGALPGHP